MGARRPGEQTNAVAVAIDAAPPANCSFRLAGKSAVGQQLGCFFRGAVLVRQRRNRANTCRRKIDRACSPTRNVFTPSVSQ
jgi:hypothetical protein